MQHTIPWVKPCNCPNRKVPPLFWQTWHPLNDARVWRCYSVPRVQCSSPQQAGNNLHQHAPCRCFNNSYYGSINFLAHMHARLSNIGNNCNLHAWGGRANMLPTPASRCREVYVAQHRLANLGGENMTAAPSPVQRRAQKEGATHTHAHDTCALAMKRAESNLHCSRVIHDAADHASTHPQQQIKIRHCKMHIYCNITQQNPRQHCLTPSMWGFCALVDTVVLQAAQSGKVGFAWRCKL